MDLAHYAIILLLFAIWMTIHILLCVQLVHVKWWRAIVAFLVPPLAPIWGLNAGLKRRASLWLASVSLYLLALFAGLI